MKKLERHFWRILFGVLGGLLILGQLGRIELSSTVALYYHDILLSLSVFLYTIRNTKQLTQDFMCSTRGRLFLLLNAFIVFTSLLIFHNDTHQLIIALLYLLRFDLFSVFAYILYHLRKTAVISDSDLFSWIITSVIGLAVLGFGQYLFIPDTRELKLLGWDDHYFRLISTIFDPGYTGILFVLGIIFTISQTIWKKSTSISTFIMKNWKQISVILLLMGSLLLTYSRASYLAFATGIIALSVLRRRFVLLLLIVLMGLGIVSLPRPGGEGVKLERTASIVSRVDSVQSSFDAFTVRDALVGKGWYVKKQVQPTSNYEGVTVPNHSSAPENSFVFIFTSTGIIGTLLFSCLGYSVLKCLNWNATAVSTAVAVGVHACFTNTLFYPFVLLLLGVIMVRSAPLHPDSSRSRQHSLLGW